MITKNNLSPILSFLLLLIISACGSHESKTTAAEQTQPQDRMSILNQRALSEPSNPDVFNELAMLYLKNDQFSEALRNINKSLELAPRNTVYFITLSDIFLMMGDAERAQLTLYRALDLEPNNAKLYVHIARLQVFKEDYPRAFENIRKALEIDRTLSDAYFWRGVALLENGDTTRAINEWQLAVAYDQDSFEGYFQLGLLMAGRGDRFAADYLEHAARLAPPDNEIFYDIGYAFQQIERFNQAIQTYERMLAIDSCAAVAFYNIGYINLVEFEEYAVADAYFSRALNCNPDYADALYNRGLARELLSDYEGARNDYRAALTKAVNHPGAIKGLNRLDEIMGR
jgi:tetratricopeptide (TPR) repeat protein